MTNYSLTLCPEQHIQTLREIRNSCREYMTHHTAYITAEQQEAWYKSLDFENVLPYIFCQTDKLFAERTPIGYGVIQIIDNQPWVTGGLLPEYRGNGLGKILFQSIIERVQELGFPDEPQFDKVYLDVRKTNDRAVSLYKSLGFKIIEETKFLYIMEKSLRP